MINKKAKRNFLYASEMEVYPIMKVMKNIISQSPRMLEFSETVSLTVVPKSKEIEMSDMIRTLNYAEKCMEFYHKVEDIMADHLDGKSCDQIYDLIYQEYEKVDPL